MRPLPPASEASEIAGEKESRAEQEGRTKVISSALSAPMYGPRPRALPFVIESTKVVHLIRS